MDAKRWSALLRWSWQLPLLRPRLVLALALASLVPAAWGASRLELRTSFSELLPDTRPSVVELRRVARRLSGVSTLIVVIQGGSVESSKRCVDELAKGLRQLGPRYVAGVDEGMQSLQQFVESHGYLYASLADLEALRDKVTERYDDAVAKRAGLDLGLDSDIDSDLASEPELPEAEFSAARILGGKLGSYGLPGGGYYIGEGGRLAAIVVATPFEAGDPRAFELEQRIVELFAGLRTVRDHPELSLHFTGSLVTSVEESRAIAADLAHVGGIGVLLIASAIFLFFVRVRPLFYMLATLLFGCTWAFGAAYLSVGYLNSATGFLVSIIAGNGINFGIVLMARFLEARVRDRTAVLEALRAARDRTAAGTLTAALCAGAAYGCLTLSDFRGFRQFGIIAGSGMLLCWIASYTVLPALVLVIEGGSDREEDPRRLSNRLRALYGRPFAAAGSRLSRQLLGFGVLSAALSIGLLVGQLGSDPLEYDLTKIRNEAADPASARKLARRVESVVGRFGRDARALLTDRIDQVKPLVATLVERQRAAAPSQKPFEQVISVFDLLPAQQEQKIEIAREIVDRLERARKFGAISDQQWTKIQAKIPAQLRPIGLSDLPPDVAWRFDEADGTRGRIVYLVPAEGRSLNDAHYLQKWADSFREVRLPTGEVIRGSGDPVIFADMLAEVRTSAPRTLLIAVLATFAVIVVAFRGRRSGWLALASVALGLLWFFAFFAATRTHINFLNFVALPITVGVGADYAVNVMKRYELEGPAGLHRALVETGGSLVLCSLTTLLGYAALCFSINGAVRSFGIAGAVGELAMLMSALLVLPALLFVLARRGRTWRAPEPRVARASPTGACASG